MNKYLRVFSFAIWVLVFGDVLMADEEKYDNLSILFTPVREEFVDELPEDVRQLPMKSMLPVVYRGGAKNWGAMKWTPKLLRDKGFDIFFRSGERSIKNLEVFYADEERIVSDERLGNLIDRDTQYREDYIYSREFFPEGVNSVFNYYLFVGGAGTSQVMFDRHQAVLLAEFYGEKLVFLEAPGSSAEGLVFSNLITAQLDKYMGEGMTMKDAMMKIIGNEDLDELQGEGYRPFQRVILRPGDILYIPAAWGHRVFYLGDSIGVTQTIMLDTVNYGFYKE